MSTPRPRCTCRAPVVEPCRDTAKLEVAEVLQAGLAATQQDRLSAHQQKVLGALLACGTPRLGGHWYRCEGCGAEHFVPHRCRNRHCPRCQRGRAEAWLAREREHLLPVPYFHVVFTLPHVLNPLIRQNQAALYRLLFATASATLLAFGRQRFHGAPGITAVLHTWSQTLWEHYHLHCIVTAGALSDDRQHFHAGSVRYLFQVQALSTVFQAKFRDGLWECYRKGELAFHGALQESASERCFAALMRAAMQDPWVVYAKRPFAGPGQVLAYLSRYTHRVAIGSGRLCALDRQRQIVTFRYKDYADHGRQKQMTLGTGEFLRRFCLHVLPPRFVKIRHYGLLGNHQLREKLAAARTALRVASGLTVPVRATAETAPPSQDAPKAPWQPCCPRCGSLRLISTGHILPAKLLRLDSS